MKQNQTGKTFRKARMRLHRTLGQKIPITRTRLAEMALEKYGPIQSPRRRSRIKSDDLARWVSKIETLERAPGARSVNDAYAYQLCELLHIRRPDDRGEIDLDTADALLEAA